MIVSLTSMHISPQDQRILNEFDHQIAYNTTIFTKAIDLLITTRIWQNSGVKSRIILEILK